MKTFFSEKEIFETISHENIVQVHAFLSDEKYCYIVMEYIKDGNLDQYLDLFENKFTED